MQIRFLTPQDDKSYDNKLFQQNKLFDKVDKEQYPKNPVSQTLINTTPNPVLIKTNLQQSQQLIQTNIKRSNIKTQVVLLR